jgi:hypothetical protein
MIILMAVMRASDRRGSGLICPMSKFYAIRNGRCRRRVAARCQWQKNFVTIVTRLGLKNGGKLIPWRRWQPRVRGRQCLFARSRSAAIAARPRRRGYRITSRLLLLCRFLDAGMTTLSRRSCGRRPKSAKARNRGRCAGAVPRALWGFCRGFGLAEVGLKWSPRLACGAPWSHASVCTSDLRVTRQGWSRDGY